MSRPTTAVSAPGKVLLAGGYLVLDRAYSGLVFGLDARIHVHIRPLLTISGVVLEEIIVKSPQFKGATWEYGYRVVEHAGGVQTSALSSSAQQPLHPNPFVETTLSYALTYISTLLPNPSISPCSVTILADDSYYTSPAPSANSPTSFYGEQFKYFNTTLWDAHKTGLGSSAALVTALTAALLTHYLPSDVFALDSDHGRRRLHNLAQAAHCAAQGKVGSGFDVASAVYGTCLYRRFSPALLSDLGSVGSREFATRLRELIDDEDVAAAAPESTEAHDSIEASSKPAQRRWDTEITKAHIALPPGLRLVMCDVDCGSTTPGMVKQVLAWRTSDPDEADMLWTRLHTCNQALASELQRLSTADSHTSMEAQQDVYLPLAKCIAEIRTLVRDMSRLSSVPIEPPAQTALLDACTAVPGVIGGVVPGAGGFDAIALLVLDNKETLAALELRLHEWNLRAAESAVQVAEVTSVGGGGEMGVVRVLPVRQDEGGGVRVERVLDRYESWIIRREESNA